MEFVRRYFYLQQTSIYAFLVSFCLLLGLTGVSLYFYQNGVDNLHFKVFLSYAMCALFLSIGAVIFFIRFPWIKVFSIFKKSVSEAFSNGVWACGGVLVTALQNQGWVYLIASLKGVSVIAEANAARLFLSPIGIMSTSFNRVFMPKIAELNSKNGPDKAVIFAKKVLLSLLLIVIVYSSILVFMLDWLVSVFMTSEYQSLELLVILWAAYYLSQSIRATPSQLLQIFKRFKIITKVNSLTAILWFGTSLWVVKDFGVYGLIISMAVAESLLATILWLKIKNVTKKNAN